MTSPAAGLPRTFWELVDRAAREHPRMVVASDERGRRLTRSGLRQAAESVAGGLAAAGVGQGSVVSWQLPNVLEAVVLVAALARLGATQNPLIPILRERELSFITRQVGTELFITPRTWRGFEHAEAARAIAASAGFEVLEADLDLPDSAPAHGSLPAAPADLPPPPPAEGLRWVYYTSGTTAEPKGARHSDPGILASSNGLIDGMGMGAADVYPIAWPIAHIGGAAVLATSLRGGVHLVLFGEFDPRSTPLRMAAHRPTIVGAALPIFRSFVESARDQPAPLLPRLRMGCFGGAAVPEEIHEQFRAAFGVPLVGGWGLTEFPNATAASPYDPPELLKVGAGRPALGVQVRAVRPDGGQCGRGHEGELRLKGPQCFSGYVDRLLDADAFDEAGWFRTGDLGVVDDSGSVRVTGRLKDIIIRNAENISAAEVEDALYRHPAVAEATVLGLPDTRTGERVVAVIVARGVARLDLEELRRHCCELGLAVQKCPEQLELVDRLPRNAMGKVLKQELRSRMGIGL